MQRSTLYSYNTVERLLRGDFFHAVDWQSVAETLEPYPKDWPLIGIGTTNWFRRNGETILRGTVDAPEVIWSDPEGQQQTGGMGGHIIQLQVESAKIEVWPLKDFKLEIKNPDKTWVPVRNLSL